MIYENGKGGVSFIWLGKELSNELSGVMEAPTDFVVGTRR